MITADGLAKSFGEIQAVKEVSFTAKNGEATGLLGPNGSGKSTTLRVIYGLLKQDTGTASIDGVDILAETRKAQGMMGVLTDTHALYARLTAREHIHYFGRLHCVDENKLENNTDELLRLLEMQSIADRRVEGFSQGEKTKVCLARALIHDPPNVLLDEPTNGLDVMTTKSVRDLIAELKNRNICVTFSSHMMNEVARICDHIVIISEGTVVTAGSAEEIRATAKEENLEEAFIKLVEAVID
jgi:sodium transport system ATP-binding protein